MPESTTCGLGDKLRRNRTGYLAMGNAIDLDVVMGKKDLVMGKKRDARASR